MTSAQPIARTLKSFILDTYDPLGPNAKRKKSSLPEPLRTVLKANFSVDFQLLYEVHGGYDVGDEDNASLLVVRVVPRPDELKRQFVWFKVTLTVLPDEEEGQQKSEGDTKHLSSGDSRSDQDSGPLLASIEPASQGDQFADVFTTNETRETALKGNLQVQAYGVTPGVEGSRSSTSEFQAHHLLRIKSRTDRTNTALSNRRANRVWWEIRAADPQDGIGDSFTVALLVKRPKGSKFRVEADTDGEIGSLSEKLKKFVPTGLRSKKDPAVLDVFGPVQDGVVQRIPKGISMLNLHAAEKDDVLKKISEVGLHLAEQVRLVRYEQGLVGTRLELEGRNKQENSSSDAVAEPSKEQPLPPTPAPAPHVLATNPPTPKPDSKARDEIFKPSPVPAEPHPRRPAQALPARPPCSTARIERLRKMAALYDRLADLLREEARECLSAEERAYADEVEREAWLGTGV